MGYGIGGQQNIAIIKINRDVDPFQPSVLFHIETSHLIFSTKQMTGFYMKYNIVLRWSRQSQVANTRNLTTTKMILLVLFAFSDAGAPVYGANVYPRAIFKPGLVEVRLIDLNIVVTSLKMIYIRCLELLRNFLVSCLVNSGKFVLKKKL